MRQFYTLPKELTDAVIHGRFDLARAIFSGLLAGIRRETGRGQPPTFTV
jgi:hypothetical protein